MEGSGIFAKYLDSDNFVLSRMRTENLEYTTSIYPIIDHYIITIFSFYCSKYFYTPAGYLLSP